MNPITKPLELLKKHREIVSYLFFGVLTTLVNYLSYLAAVRILDYSWLATALAWLISVTFAFFTNKLFVFHSGKKGKRALAEALCFFGARLISGGFDVGFMALFCDILRLDGRIMKLISDAAVVVFNYAASRLFIFKKRDKGLGADENSDP
ncbi:MAG TPA: GtrA family protein [Candidatus Faeciplasma avium]|uniref:GtrA family protein n=1 Tax=Candidatus Faeciplasma avium TaxID=2840798 RepID=A0A9D1NP18_9FIRM|nr:GtrA family protein [Candidatus Faeciplasma avium]